MGHAARGLGTGDFQGELGYMACCTPLLVPSGSCRPSVRQIVSRSLWDQIVSPRALVGWGSETTLAQSAPLAAPDLCLALRCGDVAKRASYVIGLEAGQPGSHGKVAL